MVLFGEIKPYKGLDILIEAVAALAPGLRRQLRVVVAGRPRMDVAPLLARIVSLGLSGQFDLRLRRLTEAEMGALFGEADGFVFPYRQIDASGVYHLVKPLAKWLIASRVGVFAEEMDGESQGTLVPPEDVAALSQALQHAIEARPRGRRMRVSEASWSDIGRATRSLYERAKAQFEARRARGALQG
jgi:glycosyltransferase involved in cell wall biosynthesis